MSHAFAAPSTGRPEMRRQSYLGRIADVAAAQGSHLSVLPDVSGDPLSESEPDDGPEAGTETEREARKRRYREFSMTETGGLFRRVGISEPPQWA